jgi:hypothetical protein
MHKYHLPEEVDNTTNAKMGGRSPTQSTQEKETNRTGWRTQKH